MLDIVPTLKNLPPDVLAASLESIAHSFRVMWQVMIGITGMGFLSSLLMKHFPLHAKVDDDWAMKEVNKGVANVAEQQSEVDIKSKSL